jgi:hypothetical protein
LGAHKFHNNFAIGLRACVLFHMGVNFGSIIENKKEVMERSQMKVKRHIVMMKIYELG